MTTGVSKTTLDWKRASWRCVALGIAVLFVAKHVATLPTRLQYPGELNFIEGVQLAEMLHLRQGVPIYALPSEKGFDGALYGPLYFLLGSRIIDPAQPAYRPLRVLAILGTFGCALAAGLLAYWLTSSLFAGFLAPLLFLGSDFVFRHGASARGDTVALFLMFSGFLIVYRFRTQRALLWAVPLMLVGFYYKQQFVAAPLAVVLYLWKEKRHRLAAEFAGLMIVGGLIFVVLFQFVLFPGQAFFRHFVLYNLLAFNRYAFTSGIAFFVITFLVPLLVAIESVRVFRDRLLIYYLVCAVSLSILTIARSGSDTYYFLEAWLILVSPFAALLTKRVNESSGAAELVVLLALALIAGQLFRTRIPQAAEFQQDQAFQDYMRQQFPPHTPVLSYYAGDIVRAGLALPFTNIYHYNQLVRVGTIRENVLQRLVEERFFPAVVVGFSLTSEMDHPAANFNMSRPLRQSILKNYQLVKTLDMPTPETLRDEDRFYIWVPRSEGSSDQLAPMHDDAE